MPDELTQKRQVHFETPTLVGMLEMAGDEHYDADLLVWLEELLKVRLPDLLSSQSASDFELVERIGKAVARLDFPDESTAVVRSRILETIAFSYIPRGRAVEGIPYGRCAVYVARTAGVAPQERKALNTLAALCNDAGVPSKGVEYAVLAVNLAKEIGETTGLAGSLGNLTSSLKALGLYRETIAVALRVIEISRGEPILRGVIAQAYGNMAMAAYSMTNYTLGVGYAEKAADELKAPGSLSEVNNLLGILGAGIKSMAALKQSSLARTRLQLMQKIAAAVPQMPRMQLNVALAEAVCEVSEGHTEVGVTRLLALLPQTRSLSGLYIDNLEALIRAYGSAGNLQAMARFTSQLVEQIMASQAKLIAQQLAKIGYEVNTLQPGKMDAYPFTRAVAFGVDSQATPTGQDSLQGEHLAQAHFENLAVTAELREDTTGRHAYRVGKMAGLIAAELSYGVKFCEQVEAASRLHDIGKLAVRDAIINKPGPFNATEMDEMKRHTIYGHRLLSVDMGSTALARQVALHHHERWDGNGYPYGLAGTDIPEVARIAAVADVYDALTHVRVYKHAWPMELAVLEIMQLSGKHFEPRVVDAFLRVVNRLSAAHGSNLDQALVPEAPSALLRSRDDVHGIIDAMPLPWEIRESPSQVQAASTMR